MAYFKINKTGCGERRGLVEIRYDCYLSRDDKGNEEHYVTVPDFTDAKYEGKVDEWGDPIDMEDYKKWVSSLPTITRNNPFCCHFVQASPLITDEEIVAIGEEVLKMVFANHQVGDLRKNTNKNLIVSKEENLAGSVLRVEEIKTTDFTTIASMDSKIRG